MWTKAMMRLKDAETNIKIYLPCNEQGARQLAEVKSALKALKEEDIRSHPRPP
jgi:hypothetical protein